MRGWLALAVVVILVGWDVQRGDLPQRVGVGAAGEAIRGSEEPASGAAARPERPRRDPFRFGAGPLGFGAAPVRDSGRPDPQRAASATPVPPAPVRLVGFIRQGEQLRAALSVLGRVALLAEGEAVEGYRLVALDEDVAVRVLTPGGDEQELSLPPR
jgi:hypothetical protein